MSTGCHYPPDVSAEQWTRCHLLLPKRTVVYLSPADKYHRLTHRPSKGQKGLDERAIRTPASKWPKVSGQGERGPRSEFRRSALTRWT